MLKLGKTISIILGISLVPVVVFSLFAIAAQARKKEITISKTNSVFYFGRPGLDMTFRRFNSLERNAPDTVINYAGVNTNGFKMNAVMSTKSPSISEMDPKLVPVDTSITVIYDNYDMSFDTDSIIVYTEGTTVKKSVKRKQVFANIAEESQSTQLLRVQAATTGQHIYFIMHDIFWFGSYALFIYVLMRLFSNLSKRDFENNKNGRLVRYLGLSIIIPELLKLLTWCLYGTQINPVKTIMHDGNYTSVAQFYCIADLNLTLIGIGIFFIVLTYFFAWTRSLKEDNSLMV